MSFVANRENFADLPLFLELAEDLGVDSVAVTPKFLLFSREDLERFYVSARTIEAKLSSALKNKNYSFSIRTTGLEPYPENDCFAGAVNAAFISASGLVSPCCNLGHPVPRYNPRWQKPKYFFLTFGNVCQRPLDEIWNLPFYRDFRQKLSQGRVPLECRGCHLLPAKKGFLG